MDTLPLFFIGMVVLALGAWILAVTAAIQVWGASPTGERFGNYMRLGLLQFSYLEQRLGPSIRPALNRFRLGLLGFMACVIVAIVVIFIATAST